MTIYKNDYVFRKKLRDFANNNSLGKVLKFALKGVYKFINGFLPYPRDFVLRLAPKKGTYCEIGVYEGLLSERIIRICKPKKLYLIDPWMAIETQNDPRYTQELQDKRHAVVLEKMKKPISKGEVVIVRKTSDDAVSDFEDDLFDFVYVDGDHRYEQVKKDLINYCPKVKKGGMLCGDDYNFEGVGRAVDEFVAEMGLNLQTKDFQFMIRKPV